MNKRWDLKLSSILMQTNLIFVCTVIQLEIILTKTNGQKVIPNRDLYGYGYDAYFIAKNQEELQGEFINSGVKIIRKLGYTDYNNKEFVVEDIDGRWIGFGIKIG